MGHSMIMAGVINPVNGKFLDVKLLLILVLHMRGLEKVS